MEKCAAHSREPTNLPEKEAHFKAQEQKVTLCINYSFHIQGASPNFICLFYSPFAALLDFHNLKKGLKGGGR